MLGTRWQGLAQGQLGKERGQAKGTSPLSVPFLSHSLPPSNILSSQHADAPEMVKGALHPRPQLSYSHATVPSIIGYLVLSADRRM